MAASTPSVILLKGEPTRFEREAAGTITPGRMLVLGSGDTVLVHATAEGNSSNWWAVENDIAGDDLDHDYLSGEKVQIHAGRPGDEIFAFINSGENIAIGDFLESAADGSLKKVVADSALELSKSAVAMALAANDLSASAAVDTRSKVVIV